MQIISENFALDGKEFACHAEDLNSNSGLGRSPGEGNGYPHQYSCLENSMDRGACSLWCHKKQNMSEWLTLSLSLFNPALEQSQATTNWSMSQIRPPRFCVLSEFKIALNECILNRQVSLYKKFSGLILSPQNLRNVLFGLLSEGICASLLLSVSTTVKQFLSNFEIITCGHKHNLQPTALK